MPITDNFDVLVIDPPWPKKRGGIRHIDRKQRADENGEVSRDLDYQTLRVPEIFQLLDRRIFTKAAEQHTVYLWGIDQFLNDGESEMLSRGYRLHARLIWNKNNGIAPAFSVRYCHEYVSWFYKPKFTSVATDSRGKLSTVLQESAREHSRKPDVFYQMVDTWYPTATKLDVFSREKRAGWNQFGDQVAFFAGRS